MYTGLNLEYNGGALVLRFGLAPLFSGASAFILDKRLVAVPRGATIRLVSCPFSLPIAASSVLCKSLSSPPVFSR